MHHPAPSAERRKTCHLHQGERRLPLGVTPAGRWSLFDLASDPKCERDLSKAKPDLKTKLAAAYDKWWDEIYPTMIANGGDKGEPEPLGAKSKE
jgi:hypothetical protein